MQSLSSQVNLNSLLPQSPSPLSKNLFWRHCDLKKISNQDWALITADNQHHLECFNSTDFLHAIVFINGQYCDKKSYHDAGIQIVSVSTQSESDPTNASDYFRSLNDQLTASTYQIVLSKNAKAKNLKIIHCVMATQSTLIPLNIKLQIESGFKGSLEFHSISHTENSVWINQTIDFEIDSYANLTVYEFYDQSKNLIITHTSKVSLSEKSQLMQCVAHKHFEGLYYQQDVYLKGFMAKWRMHGFSILKDQQKSHYRLKAHHLGKQTQSQQFMRGLLSDGAFSLWESSVIVYKGATQSDSSQMNNHLLLGEKSKALSIPILEIDEDDVSCSHGSTVGALDETMLFYLQSRGLSIKESLSLMKRAFIAEVIIDFEDTGACSSLKKYLDPNS